MVDEKLYADLVDLYDKNVKAFQEQNSGLIIDNVYKLEISDIEEVLNSKEKIDHQYIKNHFIGFTINPIVTDLDERNNVHRVEIRPDISWTKRISD